MIYFEFLREIIFNKILDKCKLTKTKKNLEL